MKTRRRAWWLTAIATLIECAPGCGDVTTDLITRKAPAAQGGDSQPSDGRESPTGSPAGDSGVILQPCDTNEDCTFDEQLICHPSTKRCVECVTDGHCEQVGERCSVILGECERPCASADDCVSDDPICDTAIGFCVECRADDDCRAGQACRNSECIKR